MGGTEDKVSSQSKMSLGYTSHLQLQEKIRSLVGYGREVRGVRDFWDYVLGLFVGLVGPSRVPAPGVLPV